MTERLRGHLLVRRRREAEALPDRERVGAATVGDLGEGLRDVGDEGSAGVALLVRDSSGAERTSRSGTSLPGVPGRRGERGLDGRAAVEQLRPLAPDPRDPAAQAASDISDALPDAGGDQTVVGVDARYGMAQLVLVDRVRCRIDADDLSLGRRVQPRARRRRTRGSRSGRGARSSAGHARSWSASRRLPLGSTPPTHSRHPRRRSRGLDLELAPEHDLVRARVDLPQLSRGRARHPERALREGDVVDVARRGSRSGAARVPSSGRAARPRHPG